MAQDLWNELNYKSAEIILYYNAYKFTSEEQASFFYAFFCYETGQYDRATELLNASIKISPVSNPKKYFILANILKGQEGLNHYMTGIKIAESIMEELGSGEIVTEKVPKKKFKHAKKLNLSRNLAQAYCAVAEFLINGANLDQNMTDPQQALKKAIAIDADYLEPYYQYAFFYFNLGLEKECRETLTVLVSRLKDLETKEDPELQEYNTDFLLPLVRMMVEGAIWDDGVFLCDIALQSNKDIPETWYLYAFCSVYSQKYEQAWEAIENLEKLNFRDDKELQQATMELKVELKGLCPQPVPENANGKGVKKGSAMDEDEEMGSEDSSEWMDEEEDD
jgi:tetratricopeptide (TPR) repeat protein